MTVAIFLTIFWFFREIKSILFWLYLWQLKEYHLGRFWDHFRTAKGKNLFLNSVFLIKIFLFLGTLFTFSFLFIDLKWPRSLELSLLSFSICFSFIILTFYFLEFLFFVRKIPFKSFKKPIFTKKAVFLFSVIGILTVFFALFTINLLSSQNFKIEFGLSVLVLQRKFPLLLWLPKYIGPFSLFLPAIAISLLLFDILTPLIISIIVLFFQPFAFFFKKQIIAKARKKRQQFGNILVIGITGSYGKTSTKEFLATILSAKYKALKTKEHQNSEIGIAQCILNDLKPEHEIFVVEMGAYNKGGIKLICEMTKPKIGIITGVNEQHLALFGSIENLLSAEGGSELIQSLPENGIVILNGNNEILRRQREKIVNSFKRTIYCSTKEKTDFWAEDIKVGKKLINFKVFLKNRESAEFKVALLGGHNIENILVATAVAKELGMSLSEIAKACEKITLEQGAMKLEKGFNGLNIIDSTYSANPDGVIADLEYLKAWEGKKIIIMPCLIELGPATREVHRRIGEKIAGICDLAIITTKERFKEIKDGALKNNMVGENIIFLEKPKEILEKIREIIQPLQPDDVVLLEGRIPKNIKSLLIANQ